MKYVLNSKEKARQKNLIVQFLLFAKYGLKFMKLLNVSKH